MLSIYCNNRPNAQIFTGKSLTLGGSHQVTQSGEISFGDLSAVLLKNLPKWAEYIRTPELAITLIENYEEKIRRIAEVTKDVNVTNMAGVPTWTVVLAKHLMDITGKDNLLEIWPNLELYVHGAVNFCPLPGTV